MQVANAKAYEWPDEAQVKSYYDFLCSLYNAENSIPRMSLMFNLMMTAHKPDITWLDEIAEALKNSAEGLNSYLQMFQNLSLPAQEKLNEIDTYRKVVEESLRAICYSIGVVAYRLIHMNKDESEDSKRMQKMNILQGGIEARFIPSLSKPTKIQIEGSFKITNDRQL